MEMFLHPTSHHRLIGYHAVYNTARSTCLFQEASGETMDGVGQHFGGGTYYCYRQLLKFNTSIIGKDKVITSANLGIVITTDSSTTDFNLQVLKCKWSSFDPITNINMDSVFDLMLNSPVDVTLRNTLGLVTNTMQMSPPLDVSYINTIGDTYYGLISDRDYSGSAPVGAERVYLASSRHSTIAYRPILHITYEIPKESTKYVTGLQKSSVSTFQQSTNKENGVP